MKFRAIISLGAVLTGLVIEANAFANDKPYTLENSPWQDKSGTFCAPMSGTELRAYIFPPTYGTGYLPAPTHSSTELVFTPSHRDKHGNMVAGIMRERVIPNMYHKPSYRYLKSQSVGYLNDRNEWVNKENRPVSTFENFYTTQQTNGSEGTHLETHNRQTKSLFEYEMKIATLENKMPHEQNCTYLRERPFYQRYTDVFQLSYTYLKCSEDGTVFEATRPYKRHTPNRNIKVHDTRYFFVDGDGQYGSGDIHAFAKADEQNSQGEYCDWKEIRD